MNGTDGAAVSAVVAERSGGRLSGWAPLPDLATAGPASFWLTAGWVVDLVPGGLLVRPAMSAAEPMVTRRAADPRHVDLVVTAAFRAPDNVPVPVLGAIGELARRLPEPVRQRLRLVITDRVDPPELAGLASALRLPLYRLPSHGPRSRKCDGARISGTYL